MDLSFFSLYTLPQLLSQNPHGGLDDDTIRVHSMPSAPREEEEREVKKKKVNQACQARKELPRRVSEESVGRG